MKNKQLTKPVLVSCFLAGCLEMYDFVIFGFLASIIHKNYLSFLDETTGLIITYLLFAVGFIFRPLGSVIFGYIGDVYGRKIALVASLSMMGTASLGMCLLPTYEDIGIVACYLIAVIRIIQGISVGGEYSGAAIYAIEHTNKDNIGFVGSAVLSGTTLGVLLATFVSNIIQNPILPEYSWRFAFLIGFGLTLLGYFIRKKLNESPLFSKEKAKVNKIPLIQGFKLYKKEFLASILLSGANNANYYFALVFIPSYFKTEAAQGIDFNNWYLAFFMLVLEPTFGWLSDKMSRIKIIITVCLVLGVYNLFFLDLLLVFSSSLTGIVCIMISAVFLSVSVSTVNVCVLEVFPVQFRYSCGALSYSIGAAIFGGTTPLVCSLIIENFGNKPLYIGAYISLLSILGACGGMLILNKGKQLKPRVNITIKRILFN